MIGYIPVIKISHHKMCISFNTFIWKTDNSYVATMSVDKRLPIYAQDLNVRANYLAPNFPPELYQ